MKRRMISSALVLGLLVPVAGLAQTKDAGRRGQIVPVLRVRDDAAIQLLRKRVESVDWQDEPFEQVVDWLKAESEDRVNVVPRWGQLSVESVDRDTPVTLQLNNTTVASVLNEALSQLSEDDALRFRAFNNTLRITTRQDTDRKKYLRIYDVTDLLFKIHDFGQGAPNIDLQTTSGGGGGGGGGQSVFQGAGGQEQEGGEQAEREMEERLENLRDMIMNTIEPQSWAATSGPAVAGTGRISIFNRSLIVYNTIEVHEAITGQFTFSD